MKIEEIRALSLDEIIGKLGQLRSQYVEMKMQHFSRPGSVKVSEFGKLRKMIARLITIKSEMEHEVRRKA